MVASAVKPNRNKRKRKNSQGKQFNEEFDSKLGTNFYAKSKLENSKSSKYSASYSNVNSLDKNKQTSSLQSKGNDNEEGDVSSLEDYAECSETEMEIQRHKKASISDAITAIMSEGGALDANGSLLRPSFKKKTKNKKKKKKLAVPPPTAPEKGSTNNSCSLGKMNTNQEQNGHSGCIKNGSNVKKIPSTALFPDNVGNKLKSTEKESLNLKKNLVCNTLQVGKSQTGCDDQNESILKNKLIPSNESPKKKKKVKKSIQVEEENNTQDASTLSISNNSETNSICAEYANKSFRKLLKASWSGSAPADDEVPGGALVLQEPFNCVRLPHFINSSDNLLGRLQDELSHLNMSEKNNDMYKFHQSVELPRSGACLELRELLGGPVRKWLCKSTGVPLNDKVALSASLYLHSDTLLCHDDELEGRRVAFILYLSGGEGGGNDSWGPQDGGSLDLFSSDECRRPDRVVQRLYPAHNTFAFFEVSPASFHQVSEVLSPHKVRLSVNGWFHGPDIDRPPRPLPVQRRFLRPGHVELEDIFSWISPLFRTESLQASVRKQFEKDSQIYLEDFVPEEKYAELCQALREAPSDTWRWTGPPNRAHYQVAPSQKALPAPVQELLRVLQSEAGLLVMAQLTGLPLHPLGPTDGSEEEDSDEDDDGDGDGGSESGSSDGEDNEGDDGEDRRKGKKCQGKKNCDEGSDDEMTGGEEEEKVETLKKILKKHKKASKSVVNECNGVQEEPPKKKRKKSKVLDASGMDQPWVPDVGLGGAEKDPQHGDCSSSMGRVYSSVRRVGHGCYSLILDDDNDEHSSCSMNTEPGINKVTTDGQKNEAGKNGDMGKKKKGKKEEESGKALGVETKKSDGDKFVLDLVYFVDVPEDWDETWGGYTAYVAKGEREELLTVNPRPNTLALVYRDADTFSFLKHVNCRAAAAATAAASTPEGAGRHYHALVCQYK